ELRSALGHPLGRLGEGEAAAGLDLDLGRDQLADEVLVELRARGRLFQLLEAVRELERVGIEERKLLLDRDGQVLGVLESIPGERDLLVGREALRVSHATIVFEGARAAFRRRSSSSTARRRRALRPLRAGRVLPGTARE